jgi:hypothetical protein
MSKEFSQTSISYPKSKFVDVVEVLLPGFYKEDELSLSGTENSHDADLINSHISVAANFSSLIPNIASGVNYSSIYDISSLSQFFVIQNRLTSITPTKFEQEILFLDNKNFKDFSTSSAFRTYLEETLIPKINCHTPWLGYASATEPTDEQRATLVDTLISNLGWYYFLSTSAGDSYVPTYNYTGSAIILDSLANLYNDASLGTNDGIKDLTEFVWRNQESYFPVKYASGATTYTSGTQQLDKLKTLIDTVYSPSLMDRSDFTVRDAFDLYESAELLQEDLVSKGPFYRLLKAFSWAFADMQDEANSIQYFYDIDDCPAKLLPQLAHLIGWRLYGYDVSRWRLQLKNAVEVYKRAGTKSSIQLAVDSVLSESVFDVSSSLFELWESYIPFLGLYALATESSTFKDFSSLSFEKAIALGMDSYSRDSMETNMRLAIDTILRKLVTRYPDQFNLGGQPFDLGAEYRYRGRITNIPPFEEIPYYSNTHVSPNLIDDFVDELVCFGVDQDFALQLRSYIYANTLDYTDQLRIGNSFLFFTSSIQEPPNWQEIVDDPNEKEEKYLPLWNSKSSHYKLLFDASSFNFAKTSLEADSPETLFIASRVADDFAPAHAIKDFQLAISETDDYDFSALRHPYVHFKRTEEASDFRASGNATRRNLSKANLMPRPYYGTRENVISPSSPVFVSGATIEAPRNLIRRRHYRYALGNYGYFDRTGYNAPLAWDMSPTEYADESAVGENYLPLGWVPSSMSFYPVENALEPSGVWGQCETLDSSSVYFGVPVSSTFPSMGLSSYDSFSSLMYRDHGLLEEFLGIMFKIGLAKEYAMAEVEVESTSAYDSSAYFFDHVTSIANERMNASGFPNDEMDLFETELGRYLHKLYKDYIIHFGVHSLRHDNLETYGPNIFRHTYGSIYWNSNLDLSGSQGSAICLSLSSCSSLNLAHPIFNDYSALDVSNYGTVRETNASALVVSSTDLSSTEEYRNNLILSGVDFIFTRQMSPQSEITPFNMKNLTLNNDFLEDKTFVYLKSVDGLPRIRFSLSNPVQNLYDDFLESNFLMENQDHVIEITHAVMNDLGTRYGGVDIGVWIHTPSEEGEYWYYAPDGNWKIHSSGQVTIPIVLRDQTHVINTEDAARDIDKGGKDRRFKCIDLFTTPIAVINSLGEDDFVTTTLKINYKKDIPVNPDYYRRNGHPLRKGQDVIIEVFAIPNASNSDKFAIIDNINVYNQVLNNWSKIRLQGYTETGLRIRPYCDWKTYDLEPEELRIVLMKLREFGRGLASRDSSISESTMETSGGSRLADRHTAATLEAAVTVALTGTYYDVQL